MQKSQVEPKVLGDPLMREMGRIRIGNSSLVGGTSPFAVRTYLKHSRLNLSPISILGEIGKHAELDDEMFLLLVNM